jgi:hypothetical protein
MLIRVAVIGSHKMVDMVSRLNRSSNVYIQPYIYNQPEESAALVNEARGNHVALFTGPVPFLFARKKLDEIGLPAVYIAFDELMVLLSLYHIRNLLFIDTDRLSIDIPQKQVVYNVLEEIGANPSNIYVKEHQTETGGQLHHFVDELVQFHNHMWRAGNVDFALTSIQSVYEKLHQLGVPCLRMVVPKKNMLDALQHAVTKAELVISQSSQIATGIVYIDTPRDYEPDKRDYLHAIAHQQLSAMCQRMNASLARADTDTYMIYGTRGGIQQITDNYTSVPLLDKFTGFNGIKISFGFGFGTTARDAEEHAQIALYHSKQCDTHAAFIVTEDKKVIGPLNNVAIKTFHLQSQNDRVLAIAKQTGISVSTTTKIIDFLNLRKNRSFSAVDLANYLQVSKRTAERILKKLVNKSFAEICGEEQPYQRGRPRSLYRIFI